MNNTNTNKEHLQYSDREQNMKILFLTHAKFSTHAKFCGITPPTLPTPYFDQPNSRQNFMNPHS